MQSKNELTYIDFSQEGALSAGSSTLIRKFQPNLTTFHIIWNHKETTLSQDNQKIFSNL